MSPTDYVVGAATFVLMLTGSGAGAWLLLRRRFGHLTGATQVVAGAMLWTLAVFAANLVPLALGVLDSWSVLLATALLAGGCALVRRVDSEPDPEPDGSRESGFVEWACAGVALGVLGFIGLVMLRDQLTLAPRNPDWLNFHMPGVAAWLQTGSLWQIDVYLSDVAPGHYPNNADVLLAAAALPWNSDFVAHLAMFPFWPLTGLAVYALAVESGIARAPSAMASALVMAIPSVSLPALGTGLVDSVMLFGFTTGLLFLVRHNRSGHTSDLVLAGLALGLAFGTKWYAVSAVPAVVIVWAVSRAWSRRNWREWLVQSSAVTGLIALAGGIWMIRNLVESANPAFPVKVSLFGSTIFDAPVDRVRSLGGFAIADYVDQPGVWRDYILPQFRDSIATPAALVLLGALVAAAVWVVRRRRAGDGTRGLALAALVAAALLALAYSLTPYTAGGAEGMPTLVAADARYLVPALVVAAVLAAWAADRVRWGGPVFAVLGLLAVLEGVLQLKQGASLVFRTANVGAAMAMVALAIGVAMAVGPALADLGGRARARAALVLALVAVVALVVVGRSVQQDFMAKRYAGLDTVADVLNTRASAGNNVGLAGVWPDDGLPPPLLAFGPRFENHVTYVGRDDMDVPRRYRSRAGFERALERSGYDYLIVGRGRPPKPSVNEERWARSAGFRPVAQSERLTLLRRPG